MEAMLALMARLQELGFSEETGFYKTTFISPDKDITFALNTEGGTYNAVVRISRSDGFCRFSQGWKDYGIDDVDEMINSLY